MAHNVTRIEAKVCSPLMSNRAARFGNEEDAAVAWALAEVGPNQTQVSLTASSPVLDIWANRHFVWENGEVRDTGWRLWTEGEFKGGGELAEMGRR